MEEITEGVPPKNAKMRFVLFFSHVSCTDFDHFEKHKK